MDLQEKVMQYCKKNGLKKSYVAQRVGLQPSTFSQWLHGKLELNTVFIERLEKFYTEHE